MQYRFYLDEQLFENPAGWDKMIRKVVRDKELKAVLLNLDATLTFQGNGYRYLKGLFDESYCGRVKIDIHQSRDDGNSWYERYTGTLFVTEMEFDEFKCYGKVKVTDNSFYAHISTNKKIETSLLGGRSKTSPEEFNIQATPIRKLQLFDPTDCSYFSNIAENGCFRVDDALKYMIQFMTDDALDYYSPIFGPGGKYEHLVITSGYAIRHNGIENDGGPALNETNFTLNLPRISFEDLFKELNRFLNIGLYFDKPGNGKYRVVIDEWKNLFRAGAVTTFTNLPNLKVSTASQDIYSQVKFGGKFSDAPSTSFPGDIRFWGFKDESYFTVTKCNVDNTLDLTGDFIVDTNIIELISVATIDVSNSDFGDESYDKDWFFIDCSYDAVNDSYKAKQSNWLVSSPPCYYNEMFTNIKTSERYFDFVPEAIANYIGNVDERFLASKTSQQIVSGSWTRITFTDDSTPPNFDLAGLWNTANSSFQIPSGGIYGFKFHLIVGVYLSNLFSVRLSRYDSTLTTLLDSVDVGTFVGPNVYGAQFIIDGAGSIVGSTNDRIVLEASIPITAAWPVEGGSTFECISTVNAGGIYQTYDPAKYMVVKNTFRTEISKSQTDAIENSPLSQIDFYITPQDVKTGFVDDLSIDEFNGTITAVILQGTGYPPVVDCIPEYGPNLLLLDFLIDWSFGIPADWTILSSIAQHDGGAAFGDGVFQMIGTGTLAGEIYKVKLTVSGMTQGAVYFGIQDTPLVEVTQDGAYDQNIIIAFDSDIFLISVTNDFDGSISFPSLQKQVVSCEECVVGFGANVVSNYNFADGDNGDWEGSPAEEWLITNTGAEHTASPGFTDDSLENDTITNTVSPTNKWRYTIRVTGRTAGSYTVRLGGYSGTTLMTNGTSSEILDLTGDPMSEVLVVVSSDFDGKIHMVKVEPQLNEC